VRELLRRETGHSLGVVAFSEAQQTSQKFWHIRCEGSLVYVSFGRIGTRGQTQVKDPGSPDEAARHIIAKLIAQKTGKGYVAVPE